MLRRASCVLAALALLGFGARSADAQTIRSPYRFIEESQSGSLWVGYLAADRGEVGLGPEAGVALGGRYSIRLSGAFTVEADAGLFSSSRTVLDTAVVDSEFRRVGDVDFRAILVNGSLRFNLTGARTWHSLQPFVLFGAGAAVDVSPSAVISQSLPADTRYDFGTSFAGQLGGGVEWFPARRLTLRADVRDIFWKISTPSGFLISRLAETTTRDQWTQNFLFSAGAALHF